MNWFSRVRNVTLTFLKRFSILEQRLLLGFGAVIVVAVIALLMVTLTKNEGQPAKGGTWHEGLVGQPQFVNPLYVAGNEVDADIASLVFEPLFRPVNGQLQPALATDIEQSEDAKNFTVRLNTTAVWHDGVPVTAADVVFTVASMQNPSFRSPLRSLFDGVTVTAIDEHVVTFTLDEPFTLFSYNLTFGIIPKHIWEQIDPNKALLTELNLEPIGSGPYQLKEYQKSRGGVMKSYTLERSPQYHGEIPYLDKIIFTFYDDEVLMADTLQNKDIDAAGFTDPDALPKVTRRGLKRFPVTTAQYTALFLNGETASPLKTDKVRQALDTIIDRDALVSDTLPGQATALGGMFTSSDLYQEHDQPDPKKATDLLEKAGFVKNKETGSWQKDDQDFSLSITGPDWPLYTKVADRLVNQLQGFGIEAGVNALPLADIQDRMARRDYQILLFGQIIGAAGDPYHFWHSSQRKNPGKNLSSFSTETVDTLLTEARNTTDHAKRVSTYQKLNKEMAAQLPAIFLYSPHYTYVTTDKLQGFDVRYLSTPDQRFNTTPLWYIKTF